MSNRNDDGGHLCFVPDVKGKAFGLSSLNVTLAIGFSDLGSFGFYFAAIFLKSWIGLEFCQMQMLFLYILN